ncbi:MAG: PEP-CTERM/exosortase system-associated acyltransferase [Gammaproteobacteria bacterium]
MQRFLEVYLISKEQSFDSRFEIFLADTIESKQINYNLRYQVYCEEMEFEDKEAFPNQMEIDQWDNVAVHFLVKHRASGHWLGGMRLVPPQISAFPFEKWNAPYQQLTAADRRCSVEMSRLCIVKEGRRFNSKRLAPYGLPEQEPEESDKVKSIFNFKNASRSLMWGLIRAAGVYSYRNGIDDWFFLVTPALACLLRKGGLDLVQIGGASEHRGLRIPYRLSVKNVLNNPLLRNNYKADYRHYSSLTNESIYKIRVGV